MNARTQAIARESASIEASQSRAIAAREAEQSKPRNALEAMASRLNVSPAGLKDTLVKTVFSACKTEAEFIALVIVSNTYNLNPLTKEIYAFPKKGGGIMPMVAYDGWIRIMNDHPQFDGIEFNHTLDDKGNIVAAEGVIYRKDRSRPTKKLVYLKEFKKNTEPWNNSPSHMLDVRCLCHTVRIAFGINAGVEGEEFDGAMIDGGNLAVQPLPSRQSLAEELGDEIPDYDQETGEVIEQDASGRSVEDEETARALDAGEQPEEPEPEVDAAPPAWAAKADEIKSGIRAAKNAEYLKAVEAEYLKHCAAMPKEICDEIEDLLRTKRGQVSKGN